MKRKRIEEICAKVGIPVAPDDDPRYQEGWSITLHSGIASPGVGTRGPGAAQHAGACAEVDDIEVDTELCPFCGADSCGHHVVTFDLTFDEVVSGSLHGAFAEAAVWLAGIREAKAGNEDTTPSVLELLGEWLDRQDGVVGIASEWEGGPGRTSEVIHFWIEPQVRMEPLAEALQRWQKGAD